MRRSDSESGGNWGVTLCFHGVGVPHRELEADEERYWISADQLDEMLDIVRSYPSLRLTFDDGNSSDLELVLPALVRRGLVAEFFVVASRLGQPGSLGSQDVRTLVSAGMEVGLHGMRHRPWRFLQPAELDEELGVAGEVISEAAGEPVRHAACPFGSYDRRVINGLRRYGYTRVYTVDGGRCRADQWLQSRYTVLASDEPSTLERLAQDKNGRPSERFVRGAKGVIKRWR